MWLKEILWIKCGYGNFKRLGKGGVQKSRQIFTQIAQQGLDAFHFKRIQTGDCQQYVWSMTSGRESELHNPY